MLFSLPLAYLLLMSCGLPSGHSTQVRIQVPRSVAIPNVFKLCHRLGPCRRMLIRRARLVLFVLPLASYITVTALSTDMGLETTVSGFP